jgi:nucleoside-diphosphate-sugar epimerase
MKNESGAVMVTGATGFIGRALCASLAANGYDVVAASRQVGMPLSAGMRAVQVPEIGAETDWNDALEGCAYIVHCAGMAQVSRGRDADTLSRYRSVNLEGTVRLAEQAAAQGVRRFVFFSSILVMGSYTEMGQPFTADDQCEPLESYAISKWEAERALFEVARKHAMELVVIRPPLVYGPGVSGNFKRLMQCVRAGFPLPLGAVHNLRSMVGMENLLHFTLCCLQHPAAANQVYLVSDGEDLSTTQLLQKIGLALHRPARLFAVPGHWMMAGAGMLGMGDMARRLLGSLQADIGKNREMLGWKPPVSVDAGLQRTTDWFLRAK